MNRLVRVKETPTGFQVSTHVFSRKDHNNRRTYEKREDAFKIATEIERLLEEPMVLLKLNKKYRKWIKFDKLAHSIMISKIEQFISARIERAFYKFSLQVEDVESKQKKLHDEFREAQSDYGQELKRLITEEKISKVSLDKHPELKRLHEKMIEISKKRFPSK